MYGVPTTLSCSYSVSAIHVVISFVTRDRPTERIRVYAFFRYKYINVTCERVLLAPCECALAACAHPWHPAPGSGHLWSLCRALTASSYVSRQNGSEGRSSYTGQTQRRVQSCYVMGV